MNAREAYLERCQLVALMRQQGLTLASCAAVMRISKENVRRHEARGRRERGPNYRTMTGYMHVFKETARVLLKSTYFMGCRRSYWNADVYTSRQAAQRECPGECQVRRVMIVAAD